MSEATLLRSRDTEPDLQPVAESPAMRELVRALEEVAPTPTTTLLLGSAGTGRAHLGRYLHLRSGRPGLCLELRCRDGAARVIEALRPAFSGAIAGTLLLREVEALAEPAQAALVRELQEREPDAARAPRVVATSTPDLGARAAAGVFRSDLYYRLNVFPLLVPSLSDRLEDLPGLAASLLCAAGAGPGGEPPRPALADDALQALRASAFPGEVAGLARLLRRARRRDGTPLTAADLPDPAPPPPALAFPEALPLDLAQLERLAIAEALRRAGGNRTRAARLLHIGLRTLRNKLREWREAGEEVPAPPSARQELPAPAGPGAEQTAAILAHSWARRSQERSA